MKELLRLLYIVPASRARPCSLEALLWLPTAGLHREPQSLETRLGTALRFRSAATLCEPGPPLRRTGVSEHRPLVAQT